ncbi:hypothetical protein GCM10023169_35700 [Georgenia halophila]|uniref:EfeO-type cupredoxin-like domain-containing protein n=1 Tax=Georgenia halophila TaxID=620889 RepID=A0ABP8LK58_9MICO
MSPARRRSLLAAAVVTGAMTLAGCTADPDVAVVSVDDGGFEPSTLTVPVGTEVRWVNDGATWHTVTPEEADSGWDSGRLRPGRTFAHRFGEEGAFVFRCEAHAQEVGVVEVVP